MRVAALRIRRIILRKQWINFVVLPALLAMFSIPASAVCQGVPEAPAALENAQLTNAEVETLVTELHVYLEQLGGFRACIQQKSDALKPPPVDLQAVEEGQEVAIDPQFMVASNALRDAIHQVDELEAITIERFNFLTENARQNESPNNQVNAQQP